MKNKIGIIGLIILTITFTIRAYSQDCNIYFDFNSDIMRINDIGKLHKLINDYNQTNGTFLLVGHTDTVGNQEFNLELSKRRVNSIKNYLISKNIKTSNINTDFKGESITASSDQFYNRRVEVFFQKTGNTSLTYNDFINSIKPQLQNFNVPTDVEVVIEGKKGALITIPKNAFVSQNDVPVSGEVKIVLTEYYNISDFISDKLSTVSNGNLLKSAGMIDIQAFKNNQEVKLKEGVDIELAFPKNTDERFYTFYGERMEDGRMNWISDKRQLAKNNNSEIGATIGLDGISIIITDKESADERNSKLQFNPMDTTFALLTDDEKSEVKKYYEEQERIQKERENYYNILKSSKLNYINCDQYVRDPSSVIVNYNVIIENDDVPGFSAFLIFRKTNSVIELQKVSETTFGINARLPLNEKTELLVIGMKNDVVYKYYNPAKLEEKKVDEIKLIESDYESIKKDL
ncbi:MAG: OmpA family protein [Bacteroidota bacterium]